MRRLFICNNPYQIIISIYIIHQLGKETENDILICDNFNDAEIRAKNLEKIRLFRNIFFSRVHDWLYPSSLVHKMMKTSFALSEGRTVFRKLLGQNSYDELYYNNDDIFLYSLVGYLLSKNDKMIIYRFEEGYSTYLRPYCSPKAQRIFNLRHKAYNTYQKGTFFIMPNYVLYNCSNKVIINRDVMIGKIREEIKKVFKIEDNYPELNGKYIIFEESFFTDTGYNDDFELYNRIIDYIGKEKIVIKLHPRTKINRFEGLGIDIFKDKGIPWEAIRIASNLQNVKMITMASGSVINSRMLVNDQTKAMLLYKCTEKRVPSLTEDFEKFVKQFVSDYSNGIYIPSKIDEAFKIIDEWD